MRLVWRRIPPEGFNHELIWLAVSLVAVVAGGAWLALGLPWVACPFRAATGYPCLTCGATRCALALSLGHLSMAWSWNPLAFLALCGAALFDVYAAVVLLARGPRLRVVDWTRAEKNAVRIGVILLILVNWAYLVAHRSQF
jgi:Protein of unknown function (DUF2752)